MYGNGNAEREYYMTKDYAEGEREMTKPVYCNYEGCRDYEVEHEVDVLVAYCGNFGTATYTCGSCHHESEHDFELDEHDFGYDPDTREDE
jgi:hypothetical protein